jgi:3-methyl-2-oxobutanoate hydroxymethyltransferase
MTDKSTPGVVPDPVPDGRSLKRIATMTGAYALRNYTVKDIRDLKGIGQLTETMPFRVSEARAAEEAGIDTLNVRFNPDAPEHALAIRNAAPQTFMYFALPLTRAASKEEALRLAFNAMEHGADAIMCQWSLGFVEALAESGIPVRGHTGLVPRKSTWTGGLRAVGKTVEQAVAIHRYIKQLENAGAWAVECEVIPAPIMTELSKRTSLTTISIGSGSSGDVQFLFAEDILGDGKPPFPRHSRQYCNLYEVRQKMQEMRVKAFREYIDDVRSGAFPSDEHQVEVSEDIVADLIDQLER